MSEAGTSTLLSVMFFLLIPACLWMNSTLLPKFGTSTKVDTNVLCRHTKSFSSIYTTLTHRHTCFTYAQSFTARPHICQASNIRSAFVWRLPRFATHCIRCVSVCMCLSSHVLQAAGEKSFHIPSSESLGPNLGLTLILAWSSERS